MEKQKKRGLIPFIQKTKIGMLFEQHIRYVMVYVGHCHDNKLNTIKHLPNLLWPITSKLIKPNLVPEPTARSAMRGY
jgi:hypothetical protein